MKTPRELAMECRDRVLTSVYGALIPNREGFAIVYLSIDEAIWARRIVADLELAGYSVVVDTEDQQTKLTISWREAMIGLARE